MIESTRKPNGVLIAVRIVGFGLIVGASIAVAIRMRPNIEVINLHIPSLPSSRSSEVSKALADESTNSIRADSAPKQSVVEGWAARDLLATIARQQDDQLSVQNETIRQLQDLGLIQESARERVDDRVPWLIVLAIAAVAWTAVTASWTKPRRQRQLNQQPTSSVLSDQPPW